MIPVRDTASLKQVRKGLAWREWSRTAAPASQGHGRALWAPGLATWRLGSCMIVSGSIHIDKVAHRSPVLNSDLGPMPQFTMSVKGITGVPSKSELSQSLQSQPRGVGSVGGG